MEEILIENINVGVDMDTNININYLLEAVADKGGITKKEAKKLYQNIHSSYCHNEDNTRSLTYLERIENKNELGNYVYIANRTEAAVHFSRSQAIIKDQRIAIVEKIYS